MKTYYHLLRVGFNYWYIVAPLVAAFFYWLGLGEFYLNKETGRIVKRRKRRLPIVEAMAVVGDLIVIAMIIKESLMGLIQFFLNQLAWDDSPLWALFLTSFTLVMLGVFYYSALLFVFEAGTWTKHGYLMDICARHRKEEKEKEGGDDKFTDHCSASILPFRRRW